MPTVSLAEAQSIIQHANDTTYDTALKGEVLSQQGVLDAKTDSVKQLQQQQAGEMKDSLVKMSSAGLGGLFNAKLQMSSFGPGKPIRQMKDEADAAFAQRQQNDAAKRAAMASATSQNGVGNMVTGASDALSQSVGPASDVKAAQLASKVNDITETVQKTQQESSKAQRDRAQKAIEGSNDFSRSIVERATQAISKMFS